MSAGLVPRSSASSLTVIVPGSSMAPRSLGSTTWTAPGVNAPARRGGLRGPRRPRVPLLLRAMGPSFVRCRCVGAPVAPWMDAVVGTATAAGSAARAARMSVGDRCLERVVQGSASGGPAPSRPRRGRGTRPGRAGVRSGRARSSRRRSGRSGSGRAWAAPCGRRRSSARGRDARGWGGPGRCRPPPRLRRHLLGGRGLSGPLGRAPSRPATASGSAVAGRRRSTSAARRRPWPWSRAASSGRGSAAARRRAPRRRVPRRQARLGGSRPSALVVARLLRGGGLGAVRLGSGCLGGRLGRRPPAAGASAAAASGAAGATGAAAASAAATSLRMSIRQPVSRAASRAFWPSRPMASESIRSGTVTFAIRCSSSMFTPRTWAGDSALATNTDASSFHGITSIFSPASSATTAWTRAPRWPTVAPTGRARPGARRPRPWSATPASRAIALISTVPAWISGTSSSNRRRRKPLWVRLTMTCGPRAERRTSRTNALTGWPMR